jgi:hypothetical protein
MLCRLTVTLLLALHEAQHSVAQILTVGGTYNYQCTEVPSAKLLVPSSFSEASVLRFLAPVKIVLQDVAMVR